MVVLKWLHMLSRQGIRNWPWNVMYSQAISTKHQIWGNNCLFEYKAISTFGMLQGAKYGGSDLILKYPEVRGSLTIFWIYDEDHVDFPTRDSCRYSIQQSHWHTQKTTEDSGDRWMGLVVAGCWEIDDKPTMLWGYIPILLEYLAWTYLDEFWRLHVATSLEWWIVGREYPEGLKHCRICRFRRWTV